MLFLCAVFFSNPIGNFPIHDDWSFQESLKTFINTGVYSPHDWTSMTLLSQVLWGALFTKIFGYSYLVIRISTLTLSFLGCVCIYSICFKLTKCNLKSFLCGLFVLFSPMYFSLSYSYMTDVPAVAFSLCALYFYICFICTNLLDKKHFYLALVFTVLSILTRQLALCLPLGFSVSLLLCKGVNRKNLRWSLISIGISTGSLVLLNTWLMVNGKMPALANFYSDRLFSHVMHPGKLVSFFICFFLMFFLYVGFFLLPLLILWFRKSMIMQHRLSLYFSMLIFSLWQGSLLSHFNKTMPYLRHTFDALGFGTVLSSFDARFLHQVPDFSIVYVAIKKCFFTVFAFVGACLLVVFIIDLIMEWHKKSFKKLDNIQFSKVFLLLTVVFYMLPLLISGYYDRYLIYPIVIVSILICANLKSGFSFELITLKNIAVLVLIMLFISYSIIANHDRFEWYRARWEAINFLQKQKVKGSKIDGGFEYNGLTFYSEKPRRKHFWPQNSDYIISFSDINNCYKVKTFSFKRWEPYLAKELYILKRTDIKI